MSTGSSTKCSYKTRQPSRPPTPSGFRPRTGVSLLCASGYGDGGLAVMYEAPDIVVAAGRSEDVLAQ